MVCVGLLKKEIHLLEEYKVNTKTPVYIDVALEANAITYEEDEGIEGRYLVEIPSTYSPEEMASIALDCFHSQIGIKLLDSFRFTVSNADTGAEILEAEDAEPYLFDLNLDVEKI